MKKIILLMAMLLCGFAGYADYTGTVTTNTTDLSFSTKNGYNVVSLNGGFYTTQVGAPQMPVKTLSFLIPIDKMVSSVVINSTSTVTVAGTYTMYPTQTPATVDTMPWVNPDTSIYNHSAPYPSVVYQTGNDGYPMGYHVVTITFYPLQYIPTSNQLNLYTSINFTIVYANNTQSILVPNLQSVFSNNMSKNFVKSIVENPGDLGTVTGGARQVVSSGTNTNNMRGMSPTNLSSVPDYIIITNSTLVGDATHGFQMMANWKTQKGVNTLVVTTDGTSGIYANYLGYDNAEKIRNYLKDVYVNFGSAFILLGGDVADNSGAELMPGRMTPQVLALSVSDFYYATVQGNWNANANSIFGESGEAPDMNQVLYVGRSPSRTLVEATNFANKVISYENLKDNSGSPLSNLNYVKNLSFWANNTNISPHPATGLNNLVTSGLLPASTYNVLRLYEDNPLTYFQLDHNNAFACMNTGWANFGQSYGNMHMIYHCDHSGFDCMGTPSGTSHHVSEGITPVDMDALSNGNYYGIIYTDGCDPNDFTKSSVSKHYINNNPTGSNGGGYSGGGVAFIGNSDAGIMGDDAYFENYFMQILYSTGTVNTLPAYDNTRYHLGYANAYTTSHGGDRLKKNRQILGDPEMVVWTNAPQNLTVSSLIYSSTNKNVTGTVSGLPSSSTLIVTITAWKGSEIWSTQDFTSTTSTLNFTLGNVFAHTTGNIILTVNAHNYVPNVNTINVPSITGAHAYMSANSIIDNGTVGSTGNGDTYPDAGETLALPVTITNSGNTTATNVTAILSWSAASFQIQTGTNATIALGTTSGSFGSIAAGGNANNNSAPFTFTINKAAFDGITPRPLTQFINFSLAISINGSAFSTTTFAVEIGEPNLIKGENSYSGTPSALAAVSSNQLTVKLYNIGISQATGLNATLSKHADPSGNITIATASSAYSNINGTDNATNYGSNTTAFNFLVGALGAYNINETFDLTVTNTFGRTWMFTNFYLSPLTASWTETSSGNLNSISLNWTCNLTSPSGDTKLGYNLYRSPSGAGMYAKINNDLIPYTCYLDQGLTQLTAYDYHLTVVDVNGNESPPYAFSASTSLPYHTGWPVTPSSYMSITGDRAEGSPNVYDLFDGTNGIQTNKELFFTTGLNPQGGVWGFHHDASRWYQGFDFNATDINGLINYHCQSSATPVIADIDNDGKAELEVTTHNDGGTGTGNSQKVFSYKTVDANNTAPVNQNANFPDAIVGWEVIKGITSADLDNDGKLELMGNSFGGSGTSGSGGLQVFNQDGTIHAGWATTSGIAPGWSMPVAFDFDNDNKKEIVIGCSGTNTSGANSGIYVFKENGTAYSTNPLYVPASGYRNDFPPVVADIDNDGTYEIVFVSANGYTAKIFAMKPNGTFVTGWNPSGTYPSFTLAQTVNTNSSSYSYSGQFAPTLSVADIDKDGYVDVVAGDHGDFYVWNHSGSQVTHITYPYPSSWPGGYYPAVTYMAPILADIDNSNAELEIIFTCGAVSPQTGANIYAYKPNGSAVVGFPINIAEGIGNSPCVANINDVNLPGKNELIVTTGGKFYVWDSQGDATNNIYGWSSYRKDSYNSGVFYNMADGFLYDEDVYLQNVTTSTVSTNKNRYYYARNVLVGSSVTTKKTSGAVSIDNTSNIIIEGTNTVLLQADITVPLGCTFEIK